MSALETLQEEVVYEPVAVNKMLAELQVVYSANLVFKKSSFRVHFGLAEEEATIYTDGTKLNQVITNLLNNAFRFAPNGIIEFGYKKSGKFLEFYVKDNGIGIAADKLDIIFERFCQADDSVVELYGGTGLGLTIAKAFVELLGGTIMVESTLGEGSLFTFTIPYLTTQPEED
jgi:signal transduction histidine kinase